VKTSAGLPPQGTVESTLPAESLQRTDGPRAGRGIDLVKWSGARQARLHAPPVRDTCNVSDRLRDDAPSVVRSILSTTHDRHQDLAVLIIGLSDDDLTWAPCAGAPALAGLVLHILDVEGHLAAIALDVDDQWTGENGSHILDAATLEDLRTAIDEVDARMRTAFASLDEARLEARLPAGQRVVEALLEDLDHCALHHGQAQLTRNMWEAAHPDVPRTYQHWR
jgi:hypothetical protein